MQVLSPILFVRVTNTVLMSSCAVCYDYVRDMPTPLVSSDINWVQSNLTIIVIKLFCEVYCVVTVALILRA